MSEATARPITPAYRSYVLSMLIMMYVVGYTDRTIVATLASPIKQEFAVSDGMIGFLVGLVFTVPMALALIPAGYVSDRFKRTHILAIALLVWSSLTMASGFVTSLMQLIVLRVVIAVAEAFFPTSSQPLLADYYEPKVRTAAISRLFVAVGLSSLIGIPLVASVANEHGWRAGFIISGVPGILLAIVFWLTVREPPRSGSVDGSATKPPTLADALRVLRRQRAAVCFLFALTLNAIAFGGAAAWMVPYLGRVHGLDLAHAGYIISLTMGVAGVIGYMFAGTLVGRLAARRTVWYAALPMLAVMIEMTALYMIAFVASLPIVIGAMAVWALSAALVSGPGIGIFFNLTPARMHGLLAAISSLLLSVIGNGLGPLLVGVLSDLFMPAYGDRSLTMAFATVAPLLGGAIALLFLSFRFIDGDLERAQAPGTAG